ncbi:MAG TPA: hypothetical protein VIN39_10195 [Candidatus Dormibacteraeota bacterium]
MVTLEPAATLEPGSWTGTTWKVQYSDLQPLARYTADVQVLTVDPTGHIHRTWTFTVEPGAPPDGVPVVWYSTSSPWQPSLPGVPNRLVALDWTGTMVGTIYGNYVGVQSPDGSWLSSRQGTGVMDRRGQPVSGRSLDGAVWSDVSNRYCDIGGSSPTAGTNSQAWLETGVVGGATRRVAALGSTLGQTVFSVTACSALNDRAVLGEQVMGGFLDVRVIGLSTGRTLYRHAYPANQPQMLVGSRDGQYLAETANIFGGPSTTVIRRLSDGTIVARLDDQRLVGFSWDGSLAVVAPFWGKQGPGGVQLLDWRTGAIRWRLAGGPTTIGQPVFALAQPNGPAFVVGLGSPSGGGDSDGLLLVHPDGRAETIVTGSVYPAVPSG